jgi:hypothetical protein
MCCSDRLNSPPYLIADEPPAHHVATQLSQGVGRDRLAFGGAQAVKAFGGLLQLGIEAADAEPDQRCFHSVDDPTLAGIAPAALTAAMQPYLPIVRVFLLLGGAMPDMRERLIQRVEAALRSED